MEKKSAYKQTHTIQTHVVQRSTIYAGARVRLEKGKKIQFQSKNCYLQILLIKFVILIRSLV